MLMHKGLGLDRFNALPRTSAVHALYECCGHVTWSERLADARPYSDRDALLATAAVEILALSRDDLDRSFDSVAREPVSERTAQELARITRDRIEGMLGPLIGYPEY
ncbi:2-oxo-4-hydroxy-4-carboxy-5-ureidoimidazoline decarboxylase [Nocardia alni]|uniref:2-oxo-4-hydroxy-4-carboxy-5-ureidoimidazoline decarboxylase n=1 Tax=Nocardia alni TaxID=2815723 RepID=UPI001C210F77|nr:2-oxo-4-hydroxy-4-carboxy-5-ureidoimidazoline decarboxylase [Nocardia alni]